MRFRRLVPRGDRARVAGLLAVLLLAPMVLGARCNPTPQGQGNGSCNSITCPGNQVPGCLNFCRALPPPGQARGAVCATDPCDSAHFRQGAFMCPDGFACRPATGPFAVPGLGTCEFATTPLAGCHPITAPGYDGCETGTYCRPFDATLPRPRGFDPRFGGLCAPPIREDDQCDSDYHGAGHLQCEPGTHCVHHGLQSGLGVCERPCSSVSDCSCVTPQEEHLCRASGNISTCRLCSHNHDACDPQRDPLCCDALSQCVPTAARAECCRPNTGTACTAIDQCCPGGRCGADFGHGADGCFACAPAGSAPRYGNSNACCAGTALNTATGLCARTCIDARGISRIEGTSGPDVSCVPHGICTAAAWQCPAPTAPPTARAQCHQEGAAATDVCDGRDEDCDAAMDEDYHQHVCSAPVPSSGSFEGCANILATGTSTCDHTQAGEGCGSLTGYCAIDSLGNQVNHPGPGQTCFTNGGSCVVGTFGLNSQCGFSEACCTSQGRSTTCAQRTDIPRGTTTCWSPDTHSPTADGTCPGINPCGGEEATTCDGCDILGVPPLGGGGGCGWCESTGSCMQGNPDLSGPADGSCSDWRSSEITGCPFPP